MTPSDSRFLRTFHSWHEAMGREVEVLSGLLAAADAPEAVRKASAQALEYLLRSVELIPEGLEDLGYLDDLFVFRALIERAVQEDPEAAAFDPSGTVARLAVDALLVAEFLGDDYGQLQGSAFSSNELRDDARLCSEARAWAERHRAPELGSGAEELVKIGSFFRTRLRRASSARPLPGGVPIEKVSRTDFP